MSDQTATPKESPVAVDPRQGLPVSVKVEEASAPMQLDATHRTAADGKYVLYTGVATVRVMGPAEWAALHINSDQYFEWNYLNNRRIPVSSFTDEQLEYLLKVDDRFELVDSKE